MNVMDVLRGNLYLQQENARLEQELKAARLIVAALARHHNPLRITPGMFHNVVPGSELIAADDVRTGDTIYYVREGANGRRLT